VTDGNGSRFRVQGSGLQKAMHRLQKSFAGSNIEHRTLNIEHSSLGFTSVELVIVIVCLANLPERRCKFPVK
jgi:hypothetical protein